MVLQKLIQLLFSHPSVGPKIIDKLADSWPIRRAAKLTAYFYLRGKHAIEEKAKEQGLNKMDQTDLKNIMKNDVQKFARTFRDEIQKGLEEAKQKELEKQQREQRIRSRDRRAGRR